MDKSLQENVIKQIEERETIRLEKEARKLEIKKQKAVKEILNLLEEKLQIQLQNLEDFSGEFKVYAKRADDIYNFEENARKLGFDFKKLYDEHSLDPYWCYIIHIPKANTNKPLTVAQQKIVEFEKLLEDARKKRREELLKACENIADKMDKGDFSYLILCNGNTLIKVRSNVRVRNAFEKKVVELFFEDLGFKFKSYDRDMEIWEFIIVK